MSLYHHHSLALTDKEEEEFKKTGLGVKKIFMAMIRALNAETGLPVQPAPEQSPVETNIIEEE